MASKEYYQRNKERVKISVGKYYKENREKALARVRTYQEKNREELRTKAKAYYEEHREEKLEQKRFRTYALTPEQYTQMEEQQNNCCAACKRKRKLVVDHDHLCCPGSKSCGFCVRALLCSSCNTALGLLEEDPLRMYALADYVGKFEIKER